MRHDEPFEDEALDGALRQLGLPDGAAPQASAADLLARARAVPAPSGHPATPGLSPLRRLLVGRAGAVAAALTLGFGAGWLARSPVDALPPLAAVPSPQAGTPLGAGPEAAGPEAARREAPVVSARSAGPARGGTLAARRRARIERHLSVDPAASADAPAALARAPEEQELPVTEERTELARGEGAAEPALDREPLLDDSGEAQLERPSGALPLRLALSTGVAGHVLRDGREEEAATETRWTGVLGASIARPLPWGAVPGFVHADGEVGRGLRPDAAERTASAELGAGVSWTRGSARLDLGLSAGARSRWLAGVGPDFAEEDRERAGELRDGDPQEADRGPGGEAELRARGGRDALAWSWGPRAALALGDGAWRPLLVASPRFVHHPERGVSPWLQLSLGAEFPVRRGG